MKLLLFAHVPPPHHGQSYMVRLLLDGLGGDARVARSPAVDVPGAVTCYHVDARLSDDVADIGRAQARKVVRLLRFCAEAIWCRFRYGADHFYYFPAPGQRPALYRDWIVMLLCRPFFRSRTYHWQAAGLGEWLVTQARPWERWLTRRLLGRPDLSLVLGQFHVRDAQALASRRTEVVPNGIPDPCPAYAAEVRPLRLARVAARRKLSAGEALSVEDRAQAGGDPEVFHVVFLSLCFREKGLFDAVEAVALLNRRWQERQSSTRVQLSVAGKFWLESERKEFEERIARPDLLDLGQPVVRYLGFVGGAEKAALLRRSDCLCFPTWYGAESFGLVLIEAMAFGLPIVTTRWRGIPELFPPDYPGLVDPQSPAQLADALEQCLHAGPAEEFRAQFLEGFTDRKFVENVRRALQGLER